MMTFTLFYDILFTGFVYMKCACSAGLVKGNNMAISYNGLWKILIDKNMYKKDLAAELNISSATMAKMGKGETVSLEVLQKICEYLDCNIGDIMSFEKEK